MLYFSQLKYHLNNLNNVSELTELQFMWIKTRCNLPFIIILFMFILHEVISQTQLVQRLTGGHNVLLSYHPSVNISSWDPDNSSLSEEEHMQFGEHHSLSQASTS